MPRRRYQFLKKVLIGVPLILLGLYLVAGACLWFAARAESGTVRKLIDEAVARGEPTDIATLQSKSPAEIDDASIDGLILRFGELFPPDIDAPGYVGWNDHCGSVYETPLRRSCLEETRSYLSEPLSWFDHSLATRLEAARDRAAHPPAKRAKASLRLLTGSRHITSLLQLDAAMAVIDGDVARTTKRMDQSLGIAEWIDRPSIIAKLVSISCAARPLEPVRLLLRTPHEHAPALRDLQRRLLAYEESVSIRRPLLGDRATLLTDEPAALIDALAQSGIAPERWTTPRRDAVYWIRYFPFGDRWLADAYKADAVTFHAQLLAVSENNEALADLVVPAEWKSSPSALRLFHRETRGNLARVVCYHLHLVAELRAARTALAAERFIFERGKVPASATELVPGFLTKVPNDPYTGEPMKWSRDETAVRIYSVGENGIDDGGTLHGSWGYGVARDWGVALRLLDHRDLEILVGGQDEPKPVLPAAEPQS